MTARLVIQQDAQVDLEEAVLWYEEQRPGLGEVFADHIFDLIHQVAERPHQFPAVRPSVCRGLLRRFPYAVYFLLDEEEVVIIAILHQRRDPAVWQRRT